MLSGSASQCHELNTFKPSPWPATITACVTSLLTSPGTDTSHSVQAYPQARPEQYSGVRPVYHQLPASGYAPGPPQPAGRGGPRPVATHPGSVASQVTLLCTQLTPQACAGGMGAALHSQDAVMHFVALLWQPLQNTDRGLFPSHAWHGRVWPGKAGGPRPPSSKLTLGLGGAVARLSGRAASAAAAAAAARGAPADTPAGRAADAAHAAAAAASGAGADAAAWAPSWGPSGVWLCSWEPCCPLSMVRSKCSPPGSSALNICDRHASAVCTTTHLLVHRCSAYS